METSLSDQEFAEALPPTGRPADVVVPLAFALLGVAGHVRATLLRRRREMAGLTIGDASAKAGLSLSTWNNLENPDRIRFRPKTLRQALAALDVSPDIQVSEQPNEDEIVQAMAGTVRPAARVTIPTPTSDLLADVKARLAELSVDDLRAVAALVDRLATPR